ncbi:MAG: aspartate--tRNA ligase [Candidatus Absconditabacterales bacterium]|nr:aspartate--tRNA ligase [Candidatus Absconditabacterales bacterium]
MYRSHTCGELRASHIGSTVTLAGWVKKIRNLGSICFVDLRDRYGYTQLFADESKQDVLDQLKDVANERCLQITGIVVARPTDMINQHMLTGEIEVHIQSVTILSRSKVLPFAIDDDPKTSEEVRMKYRYLDLRRKQILTNIERRAKMNHLTRNWFTEQGFLEVQTPIFTVSSPEGARDYLIPSRVNPGHFYALPQAPQQYKQLLMVGGVDKYFQIAPCFRDEDPRADRHSCEFYQIDCEMSFVHQDDVFAVVEKYIKYLIQHFVPHKKITVDFPRLPYEEAMARYGSDKPDMRFGCELHSLQTIFTSSDFPLFMEGRNAGNDIVGLKLSGQSVSRKEIDSFTDLVKRNGGSGLGYIKRDETGVSGSLASKLSEKEKKDLTDEFDCVAGDIVFIMAGDVKTVRACMNKLRLALRDTYKLSDPNHLGFVWILDFPFFEENPDKPNGLDFAHNPFSYIQGGLEVMTRTPAKDRKTTQYDLACNGYEILSGSIRNHDPEVLIKAFEEAGYGVDEIKKRFGTMYEAFQYGPPPHGGFAIGFDRLLMILVDEDNIREVYAFPKSGRAQDVMMGAPSVIDTKELDVLGIQVKKE